MPKPASNSSLLLTEMTSLQRSWAEVERRVQQAAWALKQLMAERDVRVLKLNGSVSFVGDQGDFHGEYVKVCLNSGGELIVVDDCDHEVPFGELDTDIAHSVLNTAVNDSKNGKLLGTDLPGAA